MRSDDAGRVVPTTIYTDTPACIPRDRKPCWPCWPAAWGRQLQGTQFILACLLMYSVLSALQAELCLFAGRVVCLQADVGESPQWREVE